MAKQTIDFGKVFTGKAVGTLEYDSENERNVLIVDGATHDFDSILRMCYGGEIEFKAIVPILDEEEEDS